MSKQETHRTASRILHHSLLLYNGFGEHNVSTTAITKDLGISPGNLYYHFPSKDSITNALLDQHVGQMNEVLAACDEVRHLEDAWFVLHSVLERIGQHRFIYRDINDLISRNLHLEKEFQRLLKKMQHSMHRLLTGLQSTHVLQAQPEDIETLATHMTMTLLYWLNFGNVLDPRQAPAAAASNAHVLQGAKHLLGLIKPHLNPQEQQHLQRLTSLYAAAPGAS
jgi:AcrR family transcriptional regulator